MRKIFVLFALFALLMPASAMAQDANAEELLKKFIGKTVNEASTMKVDGVSGATYSSKALIENVKGGLKYYKENK